MKRTINDPPRSGISLLEVMFAAGILTVGILGMAALLPVGAYELLEAQKLDLSSTAGRAAFRDVEVRGYLQPKLWVDTQMGMLIDPDPVNGYFGSPPTNQTTQQRIVNYPYVPTNVYQNYFNALQPLPLGYSPPAGLNIPLIYLQSTYPQLYPVAYQYIYNPNTPTRAIPLASNMLSWANYPQFPPPAYPSGFSYTPGSTPYTPFAATEGHVMVFDPLAIAEAGQRNLNGVFNGPATIPPYGSAPPQWTYIQTFPYQQTYDPGAPLLPRITMLPEWPKWPVNSTMWPPTNTPLTPVPSWPVLPVGNGGTQWNWPLSGTTNQLPAVPAPGFPPWPMPWQQSTTGAAYIQVQPRIMPLVTADRIFRSRDDLIFNPQDLTNPHSDRPTQGFAYDALTGLTQLEPFYQGNYSWFAMISPSSAQVDATASDMVDTVTQPDPAALYNARQFNVSVVVCQNRVIDMPSTPLADDVLPGEWQVPAKVNPSSLGGGEVTLYAAQNPTDPDPSRAQHQSDWLATLKPGQWLMLSGITVTGEIRNNSGNYVYWPRLRTIANWYRIVAVDDSSALTPSGGFRNVTLNGPDWPQGVQTDDPAVTGNTPPVQFGNVSPSQGVQFAHLNHLSVVGLPNPVYIYAYATVVEGVVGVYQKTITLDGDSLFAE